jgi:outer membrane protein assembly factor BamB
MRFLASIAFILGASIVAHAKSVAGADWPMFRGNAELQGVSQSQLPDKPTLLWSFKTAGPVKSSAIIAQGHVFIGSGDSNIYAFNLNDGKKLWSFQTADPVEAPPLFVNETIFVGSLGGFLYALEAATGKLRWKYKTDDKIVGAANVWKNEKGALQILVGSYDYRLHCVDAATGKSNWVYESGNYINGSPAISNGKTIFGGCDGLLHVISLADGKQVKEIEAGAYVAASAALAENRAYFGNYGNEFLCVDLSKDVPVADPAKEKNVRTRPSENGGDEIPNVIWRFRDKEFPYFSSAALTKDKVLFGGRDKRLHCLNRETGEQIWSFATQGKVDDSPIVAGEKVIIGSDDGRVYVVSLKEGKELWSYEIGQPVDSSPAVADGKIVIGCDDGNVYCFGGKK